MKVPPHSRLGLVLLCSLLASSACADDDEAHSGTTGLAGNGQGGNGSNQAGAAGINLECQVIGELCHEADTGRGAGHDCHETGHRGNRAACAQVFSGCVDVCVPEHAAAGGAGHVSEPDPHCAALGELCHPVDDKNGPLHACHQLGHVSDPARCTASFDDCATLCLAALKELEGGAGGAGGAGGSDHDSHGGAGSHP